MVNHDHDVSNIREMPLHQIAWVIQIYWDRVHYTAKPYLEAMGSLTSLEDHYMMDSGDTIVRYFLANAGTWRGPVARQVKAELKRRLKEFDKRR